MLYGSNFSEYSWGEGITTTCYLINRIPSSAIGFKTPEEVWEGKPSSYGYLKVFGCTMRLCK